MSGGVGDFFNFKICCNLVDRGYWCYCYFSFTCWSVFVVWWSLCVPSILRSAKGKMMAAWFKAVLEGSERKNETWKVLSWNGKLHILLWTLGERWNMNLISTWIILHSPLKHKTKTICQILKLLTSKTY